MRKLAAALCAALCTALLLVPATASAAKAKPKAKKPYAVTLAVAGTPMVGETLRLTGRVKGPGAGKSVVAVERSLAGGAWTKLATVDTNKSGRYSAAVTLTNAGVTQFRVAKAKSKKRAAGTSAAVATTVSKWIDLTRAPSWTYDAGQNRHSVVMGGKRYVTSFQSLLGGMYLAVRPDGKCSTLEFTTGFADADAAAVDPDTRVGGAVGGAASKGGDIATLHEFEVGPGAPVKQTVNVSGRNYVLMEAGITDSAGAEPRTVLAEPRMLCTVDDLAEVGDDFMLAP